MTGNCPLCHGTGKFGWFGKVDACSLCDGGGNWYGPRYRCRDCGEWQAFENGRICVVCGE